MRIVLGEGPGVAELGVDGIFTGFIDEAPAGADGAGGANGGEEIGRAHV